jgi:hypothetical protein
MLPAWYGNILVLRFHALLDVLQVDSKPCYVGMNIFMHGLHFCDSCVDSANRVHSVTHNDMSVLMLIRQGQFFLIPTGKYAVFVPTICSRRN